MTRKVEEYIRIYGVTHIPTRLLQELRSRVLVHLSHLRELGDLLLLRSCGGSWRHRVMLAWTLLRVAVAWLPALGLSTARRR